MHSLSFIQAQHFRVAPESRTIRKLFPRARKDRRVFGKRIAALTFRERRFSATMLAMIEANLFPALVVLGAAVSLGASGAQQASARLCTIGRRVQGLTEHDN